MSSSYLITGATGFVGGHLAEACAAKGIGVRTIARPSSDTALLEKLNAVILRGDWGPVEDYRAVNVEALRSLLEACKGRPLKRFVHLSSLGVYAARHHFGTDESEPLPAQHMDGYTQTKVESEQLVLQYQREHGIPAVVLRPGFIYGPRDRTVLAKLVQALRQKQMRYIGG